MMFTRITTRPFMIRRDERQHHDVPVKFLRGGGYIVLQKDECQLVRTSSSQSWTAA
jgi:hypothetical protein